MQSWKKKENLKRPEWNGLYILWVFLLVCVCMCVYCVCTCMLACKFVFMGSTLLSSSFWRECMSVCVFLHSPQGLFQMRAKNTEKLWKSFYVLLSEMILRKPFHEKTTKKQQLFIKASTSRRALTQLPSSLPPFLHPSIPPLFLGLCLCCVWRHCHGLRAWA